MLRDMFIKNALGRIRRGEDGYQSLILAHKYEKLFNFCVASVLFAAIVGFILYLAAR